MRTCVPMLRKFRFTNATNTLHVSKVTPSCIHCTYRTTKLCQSQYMNKRTHAGHQHASNHPSNQPTIWPSASQPASQQDSARTHARLQATSNQPDTARTHAGQPASTHTGPQPASQPASQTATNQPASQPHTSQLASQPTHARTHACHQPASNHPATARTHAASQKRRQRTRPQRHATVTAICQDTPTHNRQHWHTVKKRMCTPPHTHTKNSNKQRKRTHHCLADVSTHQSMQT